MRYYFSVLLKPKNWQRLIYEKAMMDKQQYKDALKEYPAVDMALFGRMVASDPSLNYDAAAPGGA